MRFLKLTVRTTSIGLALLAAPLTLIGQEKKNEQIRTEKTERVSFTPGSVVHLEHSTGDLYVEAWDKPEVEVSVTKFLPFDLKPKRIEKASKGLDEVQVAAERGSNGEVLISTRGRSRGVTLEVKIQAPKDAKLVIHHEKGYVSVDGFTSDVEVTCGRGDIILILDGPVPESIAAKSKVGTVTSDYEGSVRIARYRLGARYSTTTSASERHIVARTGLGGIAIKAPLNDAPLAAPGN